MPKCAPGNRRASANGPASSHDPLMKSTNQLISTLVAGLWACLLLNPAPARAQKDDDADRQEKREQAREKEKADRERVREAREQERKYQLGTKALDKRQWDQAIEAFDEVIQAAGSRVDGAWYWKAYAQNKKGEREQALASLAELSKAFPDSRWTHDAEGLRVEIRQASGQTVDPGAQDDEDLKLIAVNSLLHTDPEKALPILQKLLEGSQPPRVKEKALFVLSQSGSVKAREIVANFARGKANPDLQLKSLEYLALFGGKENRKVLADVYATTDNKKIKRSILGFFMVGGDRDRLLAAAKGEKDADLRGEAIGQLGVMGARDELYEMYRSEPEVRVKKRILDALFVGGAADEKLGLMGPGTADTLLKMYAGETDKGIRKKVIEALFLQGNAKALVEIARKENDSELTKKAVEQLSIMGSKEGTEYFKELLDK